MKDIKVLQKEDKKTISILIKIGADSFASGYISEEYIFTYLDSLESFILVYEEQERVVGFCICSLWESHDLFKHTKGFHAVLWEKNIREEDELKLGIIKTIAIDLDFRHKGIATALFQASEKRLNMLKVQKLVVPAWVYNNVMPLGKVLKKFHYRPWFCLEKFWISSCEDNKNWCPKRTENGCQCDSYFYSKK